MLFGTSWILSRSHSSFLSFYPSLCLPPSSLFVVFSSLKSLAMHPRRFSCIRSFIRYLVSTCCALCLVLGSAYQLNNTPQWSLTRAPASTLCQAPGPAPIHLDASWDGTRTGRQKPQVLTVLRQPRPKAATAAGSAVLFCITVTPCPLLSSWKQILNSRSPKKILQLFSGRLSSL